MAMVARTHDPAQGSCCGCRRCSTGKLASLAFRSAECALQAAAWRPRSRKLAAAAREAVAARDKAMRAAAAAALVCVEHADCAANAELGAACAAAAKLRTGG